MAKGYLLITSARNYPFIDHVALMSFEEEGWMVYHVTDFPKNEYGGNVHGQKKEDFLFKRTIKKQIAVEIYADELRAFAYEHRTKRYNAFSWNCEHFVSQFLFGEKESPQLRRWLMASAITGFFAAIITYSIIQD